MKRKSWKTLATILLTIIAMGSFLGGCSTNEANNRKKADEQKQTEIIVFAAASMTETLTTLGETYTEEHPERKVIFTFDSSGTLKTQIEEGAACDIFISAGQKQMDQLDAEASPEVNTDGLDFVMQGTRIDLLENKVALVVAEEKEAEITSYEDWKEQLEAHTITMAMGNSDVPVGQYTQKILAYYGLSEEELAKAGCITYGTNVKEVTTQVAEGSVDCGIIYATDAYSANLTVTDVADAQMCGQVIYPAAVLKDTEQEKEAKAFLAYLQEAAASEVFETVGFTPLA